MQRRVVGKMRQTVSQHPDRRRANPGPANSISARNSASSASGAPDGEHLVLQIDRLIQIAARVTVARDLTQFIACAGVERRALGQVRAGVPGLACPGWSVSGWHMSVGHFPIRHQRASTRCRPRRWRLPACPRTRRRAEGPAPRHRGTGDATLRGMMRRRQHAVEPDLAERDELQPEDLGGLIGSSAQRGQRLSGGCLAAPASRHPATGARPDCLAPDPSAADRPQFQHRLGVLAGQIEGLAGLPAFGAIRPCRPARHTLYPPVETVTPSIFFALASASRIMSLTFRCASCAVGASASARIEAVEFVGRDHDCDDFRELQDRVVGAKPERAAEPAQEHQPQYLRARGRLGVNTDVRRIMRALPGRIASDLARGGREQGAWCVGGMRGSHAADAGTVDTSRAVPRRRPTRPRRVIAQPGVPEAQAEQGGVSRLLSPPAAAGAG